MQAFSCRPAVLAVSVCWGFLPAAPAQSIDSKGREVQVQESVLTAQALVASLLPTADAPSGPMSTQPDETVPANKPPKPPKPPALTGARAVYLQDLAFQMVHRGTPQDTVQNKLKEAIRQELPEPWRRDEFVAVRKQYLEDLKKGTESKILIVGTESACTAGNTEEFPDAVGVVHNGGIGSGVVIAPGAVLTAGHCVAGGGRVAIRVGCDINSSGGELAADEVVFFKAGPDDPKLDLALVFVAADKLQKRPRQWAEEPEIKPARQVCAVGYGVGAGNGGIGRPRVARGLQVECENCCSLPGPPAFPGCKDCPQGFELISSTGNGATGEPEDICKGDSGGPMMVLINGVYKLAGVTRAIRKEDECGYGGCFVRVDSPLVRRWVACELTRRQRPVPFIAPPCP